MSSFPAIFRNRKTGETVNVFCMDDYFGRHLYGYKFPDDRVLSKNDLIAEGWERVG